MKKDVSVEISSEDLQLDTFSFYEKYEYEIIEAFEWIETTQKSYKSTLESVRWHLSKIQFCDCTTDDFENVIQKINDIRIKLGKKPYSENTLKGFRSIFNDICYFAETYSKGLYSSAVWGSDWKTPEIYKKLERAKKEQNEDDVKELIERIIVLPKSLKLSQEIRLFDLIDKEIEHNSYYAGIALLFYLGLRPGECCGATFGDIRPLEGYPGVYCIYIYVQIKGDGDLSNNLKTINAYRVLPIPEELYYLLSKRKAAVEKTLNGKCDHCYIVCAGETVDELQLQCNRRKFLVFSQNILRSIKVNEHVVINLSKEIKDKKTVESNVTTYLLRRNFATALSGVCGMEDDELKYLLGHDIGSADEKRHDFVNPDILYQLWEKLNLRSFKSQRKDEYTIDSDCKSILVRQKEANIKIDSSALHDGKVYLRVFNEVPSDYIMVKKIYGEAITYRSDREPSELKRIGRIRTNDEFVKAVQKMRNKLK